MIHLLLLRLQDSFVAKERKTKSLRKNISHFTCQPHSFPFVWIETRSLQQMPVNGQNAFHDREIHETI
jgi:hypothetical protein